MNDIRYIQKFSGVFSIIFFIIMIFASPCLGVTTSITAVEQENGGILITAHGEGFATCQLCSNTGDCWGSYNEGKVEVPSICGALGNGSAICTATLDRGRYQGAVSFKATASDCSGESATATVSITIDNTPTVTITNPKQTEIISRPFNITGTATFKPTLSAWKGDIGAFVNGVYLQIMKKCYSEICTYSYEELYNKLYDLPHGGPYNVILMAINNYGAGSATAYSSITISVDKMPPEHKYQFGPPNDICNL